MSKRAPDPWNDPAHFESLARDERAFAKNDLQRRYGTVESAQIHLRNAERYESKAAELRATAKAIGEPSAAESIDIERHL